MSAVAAHARHALWATALRLNGGMDVRGELPAGGCVVVSNHSSHADAPSIVAAVSARHQPLVAAAADYWFETPAKAWMCRTFVNGFPVRRTGGGFADLVAKDAALRAGRAVVVFPAGSRKSMDGHFHEGAFRLAQRAGVPVVPVRISGSSRGPAGSTLPRRGRTVIDIGEPQLVVSPASSAHQLQALLSVPAPAPAQTTLRHRVAAFASSPVGLAVTALWAFAEAISWPVVTELVIAALVLSGPSRPARRGVVLAAAAAVGSALGGVTLLLLARHGVVPPAPLTSPRMLAHAHGELMTHGMSGLWSQPTSGIPYKIYSHAAVGTNTSAMAWLGTSLVVRFVRMASVALLAALVQRLTRRWSHFYTAALGVGLLTFVLALCLVVSAWSTG